MLPSRRSASSKIRYAFAGLAALSLVSTADWAGAQTDASVQATARLSPAQRKEVIDAVADAYAEHYVFEAAARRIAAHLRRQASRGAFDGIQDPPVLAAALTREIRSVEADEHIEVVPPARTPPPAGGAEPSRAERYAWVEQLRRRNYDFVRVERLRGNIGYLKLNSFPPPEIAAPTAAAAMTFLQNCDAIVIDLRDNGGGTGDMVQLLASYFFVERTALSETFRRESDPQTTIDYTLTTVNGPRMPIVDLYVLVSSQTFSAAEAFAFALQQRGRALVVGERTRGGGNAGRYRDIPHGFRAFVPMAHATNPLTRSSWDRSGVQPDLPGSSADALTIAYRHALQRRLAIATDVTVREQLERTIAELPKAN